MRISNLCSKVTLILALHCTNALERSNAFPPPPWSLLYCSQVRTREQTSLVGLCSLGEVSLEDAQTPSPSTRSHSALESNAHYATQSRSYPPTQKKNPHGSPTALRIQQQWARHTYDCSTASKVTYNPPCTGDIPISGWNVTKLCFDPTMCGLPSLCSVQCTIRYTSNETCQQSHRR